jgi:hypothetical protein
VCVAIRLKTKKGENFPVEISVSDNEKRRELKKKPERDLPALSYNKEIKVKLCLQKAV